MKVHWAVLVIVFSVLLLVPVGAQNAFAITFLTINIVELFIAPGDVLNIELITVDGVTPGPGNDVFNVEVISFLTGDLENVVLTESLVVENFYTGSLNTVFGPATFGDSQLNVLLFDTITAQTIPGAGELLIIDTAVTDIGIVFVSISFDAANYLPGDTAGIQMITADGLNILPGPGNDALLVTVDSANTGDLESVSLTEDLLVENLFLGSINTVSNPVAIGGDVILQVSGADIITVQNIVGGGETLVSDSATIGSPGSPVGGTSLPIDTTSLLLAGVQSISMWMIPVVVVGIGIGVFVIKRRK